MTRWISMAGVAIFLLFFAAYSFGETTYYDADGNVISESEWKAITRQRDIAIKNQNFSKHKSYTVIKDGRPSAGNNYQNNPNQTQSQIHINQSTPNQSMANQVMASQEMANRQMHDNASTETVNRKHGVDLQKYYNENKGWFGPNPKMSDLAKSYYDLHNGSSQMPFDDWAKAAGVQPLLDQEKRLGEQRKKQIAYDAMRSLLPSVFGLILQGLISAGIILKALCWSPQKPSFELMQSEKAKHSPFVASAALYGGFWIRVVAAFLDGIIILFCESLFRLLVILFSVNMMHGIIIIVMAGVLINWLYFTISESSSAQATLGKMAMGIIVTDINGAPISFGRANGRYWGKVISDIFLLSGFIMAAFTQKKQALHDMMAKTLVVKVSGISSIWASCDRETATVGG